MTTTSVVNRSNVQEAPVAVMPAQPFKPHIAPKTGRHRAARFFTKDVIFSERVRWSLWAIGGTLLAEGIIRTFL